MNYSGISECDVLNGTGFRVVLFVSGCSHKCYNCQNPKTWNEDFGHPFTKKTKEYLFECLSKDYIEGITLTGGDPLYEQNLDDVLFLIKEIRNSFPEKTIWLYTGYTLTLHNDSIKVDDFWNEPDEDFSYFETTKNNSLSEKIKRKQIINLCDVVIDGEYIDELRNVTLAYRGSQNQRVIDIQQSLAQGKVVLYCD